MLTATARDAAAATRVWTGIAGLPQWSLPTNWQNGAPATGDTVVFPAGPPGVTHNDLGFRVFADVQFAGNYTLTGNPFGVSGTISLSSAAIGVSIGNNIQLTGASTQQIVVAATSVLRLAGVLSGIHGIEKTGAGELQLAGANTYAGPTIVAAGDLVVQHALALGSIDETEVLAGGQLVLDVSAVNGEALRAEAGNARAFVSTRSGALRTWNGPITLWGGDGRVSSSASGALVLAGGINGPGKLYMMAGTVELAGPGTYTGGTDIVGGLLRLGASHVMPDTGTVHIAGGIFRLNGFTDEIAMITANSSADALVMNEGTLTVTTATDGEFKGQIAFGGTFIKAGPARLTLSSANAFTGTVQVIGGTLDVSGNATLDNPITMANGGAIAGTGTVGAISGSLGVGEIKPGNVNGIGILKSKSISLDGDDTFSVRAIGGTSTPGSTHSLLQVTGTVTLGNAKLELSAAGDLLTSTEQQEIVIIDNDGADAVSGTFADLPSGATFVLNGALFRIRYAGGTGNDVTLTAVSVSYYLSEGATGEFFTTEVLIANPTEQIAPIALTFLRKDGVALSANLDVPALSRQTLRLDDIEGLENTEVSTVVTSTGGVPLIVERTMTWDASGYGAHTEKASGGPALSWYFAEGSAGFFHTYLLLANPQGAENVATVTYLPENEPAFTRTYPVPANGRFTVDTGADELLLNRSFGMTVTFSQPGMAERSMYFGDTPLWSGGHASAGATEPASSWFLAEGATGPFFETFILLANPGAQAASVTATFLPDNGVPVEKSYSVPAGGRHTINIEAEDTALANVAVATRIASTAPIVVERSQYWPFAPAQWLEAHNSLGVTELGQTWGLAEGRTGGAMQHETYILLANPGDEDATVTIKFLRENGAEPVIKKFTVSKTSRFNVRTGPGTEVPELVDERFGAVITSNKPIAVERAMYSTGSGNQTWAAGTNASATRLKNLPD
jgi:autotransporter-associated beta strand protein